MPVPDPSGPLDPFVRDLIRHKACGLLGLRQFHTEDRADLEQELTVELWRRLDRFKPERAAWPAFVRVIVDHAVANLFRARAAQKRSAGPVASLQTLATRDGPPTELGEQLPEQEGDARLGRRRLSDHERAALRHDLAAVLAKLPDDQRLVAEVLKQFRTKAEAARRLGMSRAQLYAQVRQIRERFEQARLQDYL